MEQFSNREQDALHYSQRKHLGVYICVALFLLILLAGIAWWLKPFGLLNLLGLENAPAPEQFTGTQFQGPDDLVIYLGEGLLATAKLDTDNDGIPDLQDPDDDNDGILDISDPDDNNNGVADANDPVSQLLAFITNATDTQTSSATTAGSTTPTQISNVYGDTTQVTYLDPFQLTSGLITNVHIRRHTIEAFNIDTNSITSRTIRNGTIVGDDVSEDANLVINSLEVDDLRAINDVAYAWPDTQGGADTVLTNDGSGGLSWEAAAEGVTADSLDFVDFQDQLDLDASTDILADGTELLSITNSGTGNSFLVNDEVGDTTPFVIDAAGQIGVGTTSLSDYLVSISADTTGDYSRGLFISQANDATETSYGLYIDATPNLGSYNDALGRQSYGAYARVTPTLSFATSLFTKFYNVYGHSSDVRLGSLTYGNSSVSASAGIHGTASQLSGSPTISDTDTGGTNALTAYGSYSNVNISPTFSSTTDDFSANIYGGYFVNGSTTPDDALTTANIYGLFAQNSATAGTLGATTKYGGYFTTTGTADTNYGIYATVSGATNNYAGIFMGGNVGIGTATPVGLLDIQLTSTATTGSTEYGAKIFVSDAGDVSSGTDTTYGLRTDVGRSFASDGVINTYGHYIEVSGGTGGISTNYGLRVYVSGADDNYAAIFEAGNVGIGDTTPDHRLDVETDTESGYAGAFFNDGNATTRWGLLVQAGLDDHTAAGPSTLVSFADGDGTTVGSITFGSSATAYNTTSDERLKTNIRNTTVGISDLMQIQVRDFEWKADKDRNTTTHGFIAQELAEIYPSAVTIPKNTNDLWMVDYSKLTPLIISSIQDQQALIEFQRSDLDRVDSTVVETHNVTIDLNEEMASMLDRIENIETDVEDLQNQITALEGAGGKSNEEGVFENGLSVSGLGVFSSMVNLE